MKFGTRQFLQFIAKIVYPPLAQKGKAPVLLDALQMDRVHWVGLSLGGMIGQYMALNHADRLRSLALCDTAAGIPEEAKPMFTERAGIAREQGLGVLVEGTLERWFTVPYLKENSPGVDLIRSEFLATPVAGYIGCTQAILDLDYLDRLSGIDMPTIIMVGEEDPGTPVEASKAMHERIPNSKLVVLPSAAHMSNIEQAQRFNSTLLQFLKEH